MKEIFENLGCRCTRLASCVVLHKTIIVLSSTKSASVLRFLETNPKSIIFLKYNPKQRHHLLVGLPHNVCIMTYMTHEMLT